MVKGLKSVPTLSAKEIAKKHGLSIAYILKQIAKGVKVEKEHTKSIRQANEIARDHLGERPDYYIRLDKMEKSKVVKEGISAGPERESDYSIGDAGGGRTILRKSEVKEGKILDKLKKSAKVGALVGALGAHGGKIYDVGNVVTHHDDPGLAAATVVANLHPASRVANAMTTALKTSKANAGENEFARQKKYGKKIVTKEEKQMPNPCWKGYKAYGMKKKNGKEVPNCVPVEEQGQVMSRYTERPTYESRTTKGDTFGQSVERGIYELKSETLGSYIKKASASRKKSLEGPKADIKKWSKRQHGITTAIKKLTNEETMDIKEQIHEAIGNIMEENLHEMKENFLAVLQEKAIEKLEERKKEIAANYFAQD